MPRDLLAPLTEADSLGQGDYRGDVVPYYPSPLPPTPENDLYLALAQVQQGSNLASGIRQLEHAIETHRPGRPEFYYELARAYARTANYDADISWCREALRRDARFVPALKELAAAATAEGNMAEAAKALEQAVALRPGDATAVADLGSVYLRQSRVDDAEKALQRALALDPTLPLANNTMGLTALRKGNVGVAETHFREAVPPAAGSGRGAQQSRQSAGRPACLRGSGVSLRKSNRQQSTVCGGAPQLWSDARPGGFLLKSCH